MTAPAHIHARVTGRDAALRLRLASSGVTYPGDLAIAITAAMDARLDVLRAEMGLPLSDEREEVAADAAEREPTQAPIRRAVLAFQADAAASIRAAAATRPDLLSTLDILAKMIEGFPVDEYVSGVRS